MIDRSQLKYRKILQDQKNKGVISNYLYKKELLYIRQLRNEKREKL